MRRIKSTDRPAPASVRWTVKGLLRSRGVGVLFGPPGAGKSTLEVDFACHVATDRSWRGLKVAGGPVVIVAGEDHEGVLLMLHAWEKHHKTEPTKVDVVEGPIDLEPSPTGQPSADSVALLQEIEDAAADHGEPVALVIIDTIAAVWRDETNEGLAALLDLCRRIADQTGAAVMLIHHTGKDPAKGERGGSALRGGVDLSLECDRGGDVGCISAVKVRGGPSGAKWGYRLDVVVLGKDADGDPVTACVAAPANAPISTVKLSPNHATVLRAIVVALNVHTNGSGEPLACVAEDVARAIAYKLMPQATQSKRTTFSRALTALQCKGYISMLDGLIALAPDVVIPPHIRKTAEDTHFQTH